MKLTVGICNLAAHLCSSDSLFWCIITECMSGWWNYIYTSSSEWEAAYRSGCNWACSGQTYMTCMDHVVLNTGYTINISSNENARALTFLPCFPNCTDPLPESPFFVMDWEMHTNTHIPLPCYTKLWYYNPCWAYRITHFYNQIEVWKSWLAQGYFITHIPSGMEYIISESISKSKIVTEIGPMANIRITLVSRYCAIRECKTWLTKLKK